MMEFTKHKLKDICKIQIGKTPSRSVKEYWGEGYSWVSISDMKSKVILNTKEEITEIAVRKTSCKLIPKGTLLFSFKLSIGKLAFAGKDLFTNEAIVGLIINNPQELYSEYLFYVLKVIPLLGSNNAAMGATLNKDSLGRLKIPLPEKLEDQIRIAKVLTKAEELIAKRKESIHLLDELIKSTFLDMFGDPRKNERKWAFDSISKQIGKVITGNTPSRQNKQFYSSNYIEWIKTDNIHKDSLYVSNASEYLSELGLQKARFVEEGSLLVACIAGSIKSIGGAALTNRKVSFNQQINAIVPFDDVNPLFLYWLFKLSTDYVQSHATKGMKKIITKGEFEKIKMIKPDYDLQNKFAKIVERTESIKSKYQTSLSELENLYRSLSQRAFKGELDLSGVEVEIDEYKAEELVITEVIKKTPKEETRGEYQSNPILDYIKNSKMKIFTFQDVWEEIKQFPTTKYHDFNELKKLFIGMLESQNPKIKQVLVGEDQLDKNKNENYSTNRKIEKLIAFELVE